VLARREPVSTKDARLVVNAGRPAAAVQASATPAPRPTHDRRAAAKRATKRRRNVLGLVLLANLAVIGVAAFQLISWWYVAIPATLLVAWLVACRIMVKGERRTLASTRRLPIEPLEEEVVEAPEDRAEEEALGGDPLADTSAGMAAIVDPALWDPVPVTLPTYVGKPAATRRTVRTIDLEGTGVWTSGRTESDAQLAREADEAEKAARKSREDGERATGS
jgi:hypothetical protein